MNPPVAPVSARTRPTGSLATQPMLLAKSGTLAPARACVRDQAGDSAQQDTPTTSGTHGKALV